jgi:hypothetical protein
MSDTIFNDCSCNPNIICNPVIQCRSCIGLIDTSLNTQKIIQYQVRAPSSMYIMNLGTMHVAANYRKSINGKYNPSDRNTPHITLNPIPSHGNSTRSSQTSLRPGSMRPGGIGVDIKHNSYDRYLAKLKANKLKTQSTSTIAIQGNKTRNYGMLSNCVNNVC